MKHIEKLIKNRLDKKGLTNMDLYHQFKLIHDDINIITFKLMLRGICNKVNYYSTLFDLLDCELYFTIKCKRTWKDRIKTKIKSLRSPKGGAERTTFDDN